MAPSKLSPMAKAAMAAMDMRVFSSMRRRMRDLKPERMVRQPVSRAAAARRPVIIQKPPGSHPSKGRKDRAISSTDRKNTAREAAMPPFFAAWAWACSWLSPWVCASLWALWSWPQAQLACSGCCTPAETAAWLPVRLTTCTWGSVDLTILRTACSSSAGSASDSTVSRAVARSMRASRTPGRFCREPSILAAQLAQCRPSSRYK